MAAPKIFSSLLPRPSFRTLYELTLSHPSVSATQVEWRKADALLPETYADLLPGVDGVVHTIGTLLEDGTYKAALAKGDFPRLVRAFANGDGGGGHENPLQRDGSAPKGTYEMLNRDSGSSFFVVCFEIIADRVPPMWYPHLHLVCLESSSRLRVIRISERRQPKCQP